MVLLLGQTDAWLHTGIRLWDGPGSGFIEAPSTGAMAAYRGGQMKA
jgi:hypothetical protein